MQEEELEQEADLAKAEQAAHSETLRDTAPVIDANKVRRQTSFMRPYQATVGSNKKKNSPTYLTLILKFITLLFTIKHIKDKISLSIIVITLPVLPV